MLDISRPMAEKKQTHTKKENHEKIPAQTKKK